MTSSRQPPVDDRPAAAGSAPAPSAGYSGTPLHRKLGVKPRHRVLAVGVPEGWDVAVLDPEGTAEVTRSPEDGGGYDVVLLFCPDGATLADRLPAAMALTTIAGRCWVAWPKRGSALARELGTAMREDDVRAAALPVGWVDVKVCAVDANWSGLCLVRRKENR